MAFSFLQKTFRAYASRNDLNDPVQALLWNEFLDESTSFDETQIQDSWSWRNVHVARQLAYLLVDDKGELKEKRLSQAIDFLQHAFFSLGPGRFHDDVRHAHLLVIFTKFLQEKDVQAAFKKIRAPERHSVAEVMIRETLLLTEKMAISDAEARRATFSAVLTMLRQNIGSCFATAPAIMIEQEQTLQFLLDIAELFGTGKLKRVFGGIEHVVPFSSSWGMGDLYKPVVFANIDLKKLFQSPGVQAALTTLGVSQKEKVIEELLETEAFSNRPFFVVTPDYLLKHFLLFYYRLSEEAVKSYQESEKSGLFGKLLIAPPVRPPAKKVSQFLKSYQIAKKAFAALTDNALLKAWEFTLAGFAETKAEFAKWNLYISLGVNPEEPFGIGATLYEKIQEKIEEINRELEEKQSHYDHLFAQAKYLEGRMRRASTESELNWVRAEYEVQRGEINRILAARELAYEKGERMTKVYSFLIEFYGQKVREYFQDVYDPELLAVSVNPFDDTPAGFRLVYKHGRDNPTLWTKITTSGEYINALSSFFMTTEHELLHHPFVEGLQKELSDFVTAIITTIKRPEFLESSIERLARSYNEPLIEEPLEHLDRIKRTPWAYVSGGTMGTLAASYYEQIENPKEAKKWIENESELLAFLIDCMKESSSKTQKIFEENQNRSLLAFSPTHAFLCKPGWARFKEAWQSDVYTYTWVRDQLMTRHLRFLDQHVLTPPMVEHLLETLVQFIPRGYQTIVQEKFGNFHAVMHISYFREGIIHELSHEKWLNEVALVQIAEEIDSLLYRSLPLCPAHEVTDRLRNIFAHIGSLDASFQKKLNTSLDKLEISKYRFYSALELRAAAQAVLILATQKTRASRPYYQMVLDAMRELNLCYPSPLLVGDTNWVKNTFGFVVNPGTAQLEFWRFDFYGSEGRPISLWKPYLDGRQRKEWGLYMHPHQYGQF